MGYGEHMRILSQYCVISLHRCFVTVLHSGENSRQAQADDDGHFRHQPQSEVEGVNNNETANGKACQVALKCHFRM